MEYYLFDIEKKTSYYRALYNFLGVLPFNKLTGIIYQYKARDLFPDWNNCT